MSIPLFSTQIEKTTAEWDTENPILGEDVIGIEIMSNGFNRFKRGNGIDHWSLLPYIDKIPPVNITAAMIGTYTQSETDELLNDKFGSADVIPVSNGGTGRSTLTSGYFIRGNGTSAVTMSSAASARNAMGLGNTTGALPVANGGTGSTTAEAALQNLGLIAAVGETIDINTNQCYTGYVSSSTKAITFSVPLPKWLPSNAASVTVNSLKMNIRKVGGGYIGGSSSFVSGGFEYIGNTNYTVSIEISSACRHMILVTLTNDTSTMDTQNNTPVSLVGTIRFTIN